MSKKIDQTSLNEVFTHAKKLIGKTLRTADNVVPIDFAQYELEQGMKTKGSLGTILETHYFGINPGADARPDFLELGIELKSHPITTLRNGTYTSKERLVLGMIDYKEIIKESFNGSKFYMKNNKILLMSYLHDKITQSYFDYPFLLAEFLEYENFSEEDRKIILDDWEKIKKKIEEGKAHELSEGDTMYLGAATKSATSLNRREQPNSDIFAKPRAFSYKNGFMTTKIRQFLNKENDENDLNYKHNESFDSYIYKMLSKHIGKSINELYIEYGEGLARNGKGINQLLIQRALGSFKKEIPEFKKADVTLKVVRLRKNDMPKEAISFPAFKFDEIIEESSWEESKAFNDLFSSRFLFVFFKENEKAEYILDSYKFWSMPVEDIKLAEKVWDRTREVIKSGRIISGIKQDKKDNYRIENNFPKTKDSKAVHVRPHGKNRADTYPLLKTDPYFKEHDVFEEIRIEFDKGNSFTKQAFWFNQDYIKDIYLNSK